MQLALNGVPLPHGQDVTVGDVVISYASLVNSEDAREEWGVTVLPDPEPEPTRRLIPKSVVQERMNDIGKLGAAFAALNSNPIFFGRWFAPDWPNVYFDDEGLLSILTAIGCTEAEVASVTGP